MLPSILRSFFRTSLICLTCLTLACLTFSFIGFTASAEAAIRCRTLKGQPVCIEWIKRSAKRYWEYKATVSIAGVKQPAAVYDCLSRVIVEPDDTAIAFGKNDPGAVVCDLFRERSKSMRLSDLSGPRQ
ncbi:MAG: hypothetical protein RLZZ511_2029 [Cyanobacteriota bacterium]|jgi:hypothetical protein